MKKKMIVISVGIFLISCNNVGTKSGTEETTDTTKVKASESIVADTSNPQMEMDTLKNITINEKYFNQKTAKAATVNQQTFRQLNFEKLNGNEGLQDDPNSKFKIIDTIFNKPEADIVIISGESENEHWAWLAQLDRNNKIVNSTLVFYEDFVEYFSSTTSKIQKNTITIITQTDTEGKSKQVKRYVFTPGQTLKLVK
jgi:hypothetical protein